MMFRRENLKWGEDNVFGGEENFPFLASSSLNSSPIFVSLKGRCKVIFESDTGWIFLATSGNGSL